MTLLPRSLTFRVTALSSIWTLVTLLIVSTVIGAFYRQTSERGFESLLSAHLFNLISSVSVTQNGFLTGSVNLGDLRFSDPGSGWYWSVEPVSGGVEGQLSSLSLTDQVASPPATEVPFNAEFQRSYQTKGPSGEDVEVLESEIVLDSKNRIARFRVMGNRSELEREIDAFERRLYTYLALFGLGTILINAAVIIWGLRPLARVREALANVREGTAKQLDGIFPTEIEPLAAETNALIENNKRIVERARTQVGNLAHSLKTPLAVLMNEARAIGGDQGKLISTQAEAMQQQLEHYLQRARIAAQRDSIVFRTPVRPVLERMVRVMGKLNPELRIDFRPAAEKIIFAGEQEDLEEIVGNLLENAMKWGRSTVRVSLGSDRDRPGLFQLLIEDDGPGIPPEKAQEVLKRGKRLDETKPGSGLGLAIVADLIKEYQGQLALERSPLGGLRAVVELRRSA